MISDGCLGAFCCLLCCLVVLDLLFDCWFGVYCILLLCVVLIVFDFWVDNSVAC